MTQRTISGAVTQAKLASWLVSNRPDLELWDDRGTKGFYQRSLGPAASFASCGPTWRDVAGRLEAVSEQ